MVIAGPLCDNLVSRSPHIREKRVEAYATKGCEGYHPGQEEKGLPDVLTPVGGGVIVLRWYGPALVFAKYVPSEECKGTLPEGYVITWTAVGLGLVVGIGMLLLMFLLPYLLAPRNPSKEKATTYECGMEPAPHVWSQLHIRYYIFAILFLIFDVEAVFLFPWAVVFLGNKIAFYSMLIFLAVLFSGIVYAWRKGVLQWSR